MSRFKLIWVKNEMVSVGEVGGDSWYSGKVNFVALCFKFYSEAMLLLALF